MKILHIIPLLVIFMKSVMTSDSDADPFQTYLESGNDEGLVMLIDGDATLCRSRHVDLFQEKNAGLIIKLAPKVGDQESNPVLISLLNHGSAKLIEDVFGQLAPGNLTYMVSQSENMMSRPDRLVSLLKTLNNPRKREEMLKTGIANMLENRHVRKIGTLLESFKDEATQNVAIQMIFLEGSKRGRQDLVNRFCIHPAITPRIYADGVILAGQSQASSQTLERLLNLASYDDLTAVKGHPRFKSQSDSFKTTINTAITTCTSGVPQTQEIGLRGESVREIVGEGMRGSEIRSYDMVGRILISYVTEDDVVSMDLEGGSSASTGSTNSNQSTDEDMSERQSASGDDIVPLTLTTLSPAITAKYTEEEWSQFCAAIGKGRLRDALEVCKGRMPFWNRGCHHVFETCNAGFILNFIKKFRIQGASALATLYVKTSMTKFGEILDVEHYKETRKYITNHAALPKFLVNGGMEVVNAFLADNIGTNGSIMKETLMGDALLELLIDTSKYDRLIDVLGAEEQYCWTSCAKVALPHTTGYMRYFFSRLAPERHDSVPLKRFLTLYDDRFYDKYPKTCCAFSTLLLSHLISTSGEKMIVDFIGQPHILSTIILRDAFQLRFNNVTDPDREGFLKYAWREAVARYLKEGSFKGREKMWRVMRNTFSGIVRPDFPPSDDTLALALNKIPTKEQLEKAWTERNVPGYQETRRKRLRLVLTAFFPDVLVNIVFEYIGPEQAATWLDIPALH